MKSTTLLFLFLICFSCKKTDYKASQAVVQDYAFLFSKKESNILKSKIINYEKTTTNQICVYTIDSIPNKQNALFYATNLSNTLGIGTKEKDNGLLILISRLDRKIAIATGYGTEKIITDSIAETIIEKTIVPKFKNSLYFEGLNKALDSIIYKWK